MVAKLTADTRRRIELSILSLGSENQEIWSGARRRLIRFGSKALDALIAACDSPDPQVRFRAVMALGDIGDGRALETIIRLTADSDDHVSYDAYVALGELGDERAIPILAKRVRAARPHRDDVNSSAAAMALAKYMPRAQETVEKITQTGTEYGLLLARQILDPDAD